MKNILLCSLLVVVTAVLAPAQTLQIDPVHEGGTVTMEVLNGTPGAYIFICYSTNGTGPHTWGNGVTLDLSMPIRYLNSFFRLDSLGNGTKGPFLLPSGALAGQQAYVQGLQYDWLTSLITVTNMVPVTVQNTLNNPPTAVDDNATTDESVLVTINVLANDSDPDGDLLSIVAVAGTGNASLAIVNGQVEYTPQASYLGTDTFTYTIEDSFAAQATATVYVDVVSNMPNDMAAIPGGTFEMGDHAGVGQSDEQPVHSVTLDAFFMGKYEVSNIKFVGFLNNTTVTVLGSDVYQVGGSGQRIGSLSGGLTHNGSTFGIVAGYGHHPVVSQTWYGAALYCNYLSTLYGRTPCYDETTFACDFTAGGFRLPTEAEWEYASRGGEHSPYYQYPWGSNSITSSDANYDGNIGDTVDVGSYAANGYGLYDMAGNVEEWCNDRYDSSYYSNSPSTNPTGPASGSIRVIRGGSYFSAFGLRCANRGNFFPYNYSATIGFRVLAVQ